MKLFPRKQKIAGAAAASPQILRSDCHPFHLLGNYVPLRSPEANLYRSIRESIPLVDACIGKLVRLCGGVSVSCDDPTAQKSLQAFWETVPTGYGTFGMNAFLTQYLDSMLMFGQGIGEILLSRDRLDIAGILCGRPEDVVIEKGASSLDFSICRMEQDGQIHPLPYQNLLLFTPFNPEAYSPYGVSLLRSMPFLAEMLNRIYHAVGVNWERMGNTRFAVVYKPMEGELDRGMAQERSRLLAEEWSRAMSATRNGSVRDFVAVGNVEIRAIGADCDLPDSSIPVRQILEQLVSKTGIPPFMLGLSWASTERMSVQQADMLTSEITAIRRSVTPILQKICTLWLRLNGFSCQYQILWDDINLQDLEAEAKAELYRQQARQIAAALPENTP